VAADRGQAMAVTRAVTYSEATNAPVYIVHLSSAAALAAELLAHAAAALPSTAEVRAWARRGGLDVSDRGRLRPEIMITWRQAHRRET
jgi:hypothetical protein